jgi:5'-phosphate synthase pdxT subunit
MVRKGNVLGMTFHPELTGKTNIHEYFLHMIEGERLTSTGNLSR